jgi:putative endonuclease
MKEVYFAYVLKSKHFDYFYKGHCKDLQKRLDQHNSGMTVSIRPYVPFEIVYFEEFETLSEALTEKNTSNLQGEDNS